MELPEEIQSRKLCAAFAAVGRIECAELMPIWEQVEWARMYASKPALVNMPKPLTPALRDVNGSELYEIDFSSFELRIAANITGQKLPEGDTYEIIGEGAGISRKRTKDVINPLLHGQTMEQIWYAKDGSPSLKNDRPLVERELARALPDFFAGVDNLRKDPSRLQRRGAEIFFTCMSEAMDTCSIASAGLPKHDGWIIGATEAQAKGVQRVFQHVAERITGSHFPVKCERVHTVFLDN